MSECKLLYISFTLATLDANKQQVTIGLVSDLAWRTAIMWTNVHEGHRQV